MMKRRPSAPFPGLLQAGLSLIEVLIALLVLSIGLVGLGALLLTSLSNVHSSANFSLASSLALDLEERLWYETSRISADAPNTLDEGCLSEGQIQSAINTMTTQWADPDEGWEWGGETQRLRLNDLEMDFDEQDSVVSPSNASIRWKTVPVTIDWRDARFDDLNGDRETYTAKIRIPCRPNFNLES